MGPMAPEWNCPAGHRYRDPSVSGDGTSTVTALDERGRLRFFACIYDTGSDQPGEAIT